MSPRRIRIHLPALSARSAHSLRQSTVLHSFHNCVLANRRAYTNTIQTPQGTDTPRSNKRCPLYVSTESQTLGEAITVNDHHTHAYIKFRFVYFCCRWLVYERAIGNTSVLRSDSEILYVHVYTSHERSTKKNIEMKRTVLVILKITKMTRVREDGLKHYSTYSTLGLHHAKNLRGVQYQ